MGSIRELIYAVRLLIPVGAALRSVYIAIAIQADPDQAPVLKRRLRNLLIFTAVSEGRLALLQDVQHYF